MQIIQDMTGGDAPDGRPKGWFQPGDAALYVHELQRIRAGVVVEIGVFLGRSTSYSAPICKANATRLVAIDTWVGGPPYGFTEKALEAAFRANMTARGVMDAIDVLSVDSIEATSRFADESVDLVYIDAGHHKPRVLAVIEAWLPKVKTGGALMGHDYSKNWPGVIEAVNERLGPPEAVSGATWKVTRQAHHARAIAHAA